MYFNTPRVVPRTGTIYQMTSQYIANYLSA